MWLLVQTFQKLVELMYKRILVPLEHSPYDAAIVEHVRMFARVVRSVDRAHSRRRRICRAQREAAQPPRIGGDASRPRVSRADVCVARGRGLRRRVVARRLAIPSKEIAEAAAREQCDLIAMSTHGHKFIKDMLYGSVANEVRHMSRVPVLLVRGERKHDAAR